jgi:RNA polymerase sigma-70 factor (ECF subfamily)
MSAATAAATPEPGHAPPTPAQAAEAAARRSYGRLLAWLAWQWRDIAAAEDALSDAFATALSRWPADGVPSSPESWLLSTARHRLLMQARRRRLEADPAVTILLPCEDEAAPEPSALPDARLRLMFVCTHPAIDAGVRSPLMLQTVLGLDAARIASAFLVKPEAMTKRLQRAKAKIRDTGIRFEEPEPSEWAERCEAVLEAIYGAYTLHWGQADDEAASQLADEACWLADLAATLMPREAEALGLAALLAYCEARRPARLDGDGRFVPLPRQDPTRWDGERLRAAQDWLARAAALGQPGAYQLEAAVQCAHIHGVLHGRTPWEEIAMLYSTLVRIAPTIGACIGHAVATARARRDPAAGLALLDELDPERVQSHQPWWAARADLLRERGDRAGAVHAYERALALTSEPALRDWLEERLRETAA